MCGIVGGTHVSDAAVERALQTLRHRGPDAQAAWRAPGQNVTLGHTRLAIIDLDSAANQPMHCRRTGNVIAFNGEIYNYRAVRAELAALGWEFRTKSDTEVLLAAYGQWGPDCLKRLNGMFALALYEPARGRLFFGRDRVGKKPLYYTRFNGSLTWASEIKAILALRPELPRTVDADALNEYMHIGYIPGELSIYQEIRKLPAAHYALFDLESRQWRAERYWSLGEPSLDRMDDHEAEERLESLLADSVRIRLESDVPIGILLSGGLDSSLIAAMAARENSGLVAYTAQFADSKYDETGVAARVAEWAGVRHEVVPVEAGDSRYLDQLGAQFDEPLADSSLLPTYLVSRAIRQHVTVALSGDGGDELFGGYDLYRQVMRERRWEQVPGPVRALLAPGHHLLAVGKPGKNFLRRLPTNGAGRYRAVTGASEHVARSPLSAELADRIRRLPTDSHRRAIEKSLGPTGVGGGLTLLQAMTRLDFGSWLVDDVLVKVDRASMLASLEVRSPLLDYRIAEFAYSLPDRLRCDGHSRKVLLQRVARRYLPPDFPFERKMGFNIPETEWFQGDWSGLLESAVCQADTILDPARVAAIQAAHHRTSRYGRELFKILMLAQFARHYGAAVA